MPRQINPPTLVEYGRLRFVIADAPSDTNLPYYIKDFQRYNVTDVVRVCEPTYSADTLERSGIKIHDWKFDDGESPPLEIVDRWLSLVDQRFSGSANTRDAVKPAVAIHCVAGLGRYVLTGVWIEYMPRSVLILLCLRAPVLVAIALIENGMSPLDSVLFIRERRRGAINKKQLKYLETYRRRGRQRCSIM